MCIFNKKYLNTNEFLNLGLCIEAENIKNAIYCR